MMITNHKISDLKYKIERISDDPPSAANWINFLNVLTVICSLLHSPVTTGLCLLELFGIPLYSAFASIATSNYRTAKSTEIQRRISINGLDSGEKKQ